MRITLNLATQPLRRDRSMMIASVAVGILLLFSLGALVTLAVADHRAVTESRSVIAGLQKQMAKISRDQSQFDARMNQPGSAGVLDRSVLYNTLIRRKAVSWTRIFSDLETVLPHNVRVMAIRPQLNTRNELSLDMTVASDTPESVVTFIMNLESSDLFGAVTPSAETPPTQSDPFYQYRLSVTYVQKL